MTPTFRWSKVAQLVLSAASIVAGLAEAQCQDYTTYAQQRHAPYSSGTLQLPYQRPLWVLSYRVIWKAIQLELMSGFEGLNAVLITHRLSKWASPCTSFDGELS